MADDASGRETPLQRAYRLAKRALPVLGIAGAFLYSLAAYMKDDGQSLSMGLVVGGTICLVMVFTGRAF